MHSVFSHKDEIEMIFTKKRKHVIFFCSQIDHPQSRVYVSSGSYKHHNYVSLLQYYVTIICPTPIAQLNKLISSILNTVHHENTPI